MHNTPDYRGVFLRGIGGNAASLGELQGDAIRNIIGEFNTEGRVVEGKYATGAFYIGQDIDFGDGGVGNWGEGFRIKFDASRIVPTSNENRPINRAVRYFIKAK